MYWGHNYTRHIRLMSQPSCVVNLRRHDTLRGLFNFCISCMRDNAISNFGGEIIIPKDNNYSNGWIFLTLFYKICQGWSSLTSKVALTINTRKLILYMLAYHIRFLGCGALQIILDILLLGHSLQNFQMHFFKFVTVISPLFCLWFLFCLQYNQKRYEVSILGNFFWILKSLSFYLIQPFFLIC